MLRNFMDATQTGPFRTGESGHNEDAYSDRREEEYGENGEGESDE
jgi:hypothetical protein